MLRREKDDNRRVLLKISGEALQERDNSSIIDADFATGLAAEIKEAVARGVQVAIVVGGGNIFRGTIAQALGMDRVKGDYMGMMATVINALAMESAFEMVGQEAIVQSAVATSHVVGRLSQPKADIALNKGKVVIFAGGTGNPYFTTDTAAALRAVELRCDALIKATKVNGIYAEDPVKNPQAERLESLSFQEVLEKNLRVMDQTAFSLCKENGCPIVVFDLYTKGNILKALTGEKVGSIVQ